MKIAPSLHLFQTMARAKPTTDNLALAEKDSYSLQGRQQQIARLAFKFRQADWVNDNITRVKDYAQRNFVDF